jgi:hypothetical protein
MPGRLTNFRNTIAAAFVDSGRNTVPTVAQFNALSTGLSSMSVRRVFGSFVRGMKNSLVRARVTNNSPAYANALVNQTVEEADATGLSYTFADNTFTDEQTDSSLTYSATLSDGSALPLWLTFTPSTKTFAGVAPAVDEETILTVRVTATDGYGKTASGTFTITITVAA